MKLSPLSRQLSVASATSRKDLRARETRHLLNARAEVTSSSVNRFRRRQLYLDIAWQRVYERPCQVAPHVPEAQDEIERKIGQSLPRSGPTA
jgi:hypothetical protein